MKQYSPARLTRPLMRRKGAQRGESDFQEISWARAFELMEQRFSRIRASDPKRFALCTGRDQMQALTGMFAKQFGTPNYSAHGGFCSVNMAGEPGGSVRGPRRGRRCGWRGKGGEKFLRGEPNPRQWEMYQKNGCFYHYRLPRSYQYMRNWNKGYLSWAQAHGMTRYLEPITIHLYSEVLQRFRLAAQGKGAGRKPPERLRKRVETHFDPLLVFVLPVALIVAAYLLHSATLPVLAFALQYLGLMAERWYFFAEARHPQNLYYQSIA